ncbi:PDZ domain-containing protein [Planctomicrobium sp. SH661]|uniref:PDZ domain-containing protein n=1 Tax=Planctomicrobium sp. SH661 TaxID=3448124 RepID=UPI003F5B713E
MQNLHTQKKGSRYVFLKLNSMRLSLFLSSCTVVTLVTGAASCFAADLLLQEQQAIQKAVAAAEPSIVRIETVGGVDLVGDLLTGTGPTTGVVVRSDGYIITSRFNFLSKPASVVVTLPDERQFAAEIVSSDMSRMLTLLKIKADDLIPAVAVPKNEFQVGQWALALGRTFDPKFPNASVGIVSAIDRVWGRAIQTDAKTSPVNYGGPLIDLTGRCLGIIVPLSPDKQEETAGVEWYDSGIGFAVPLADVEAVLPRLIEKETLKPGLMGIGFEDQGPVSGSAKVIRVRPESPADQAGILQDDVIVSVNGKPVEKLNDLKHIVGSMYAKDVAHLSIRRGEETLQKEITLTDELVAYQFPDLGILPSRSSEEAGVAGVRIRTVVPGSPADSAGLKAGDLIEKINDDAVASIAELTREVRRNEPGKEITVLVRRGEQQLPVKAKLVPFPDEPPKSLERIVIPSPETPPGVETGRFNHRLPQEGLAFWAYVPENYRADTAWGLLVWLHPPGDSQEAETLQAWSAVCRERGIILAGPRAGDVSGWSADQEAQVKDMIEWIREKYRIDPARIVAMGQENSGPFASRLAFKYRDLFRGLILLSAPLRSPPPDSDPDYPFQLVCVCAASNPTFKMVKATVEAMRKRNFPSWLIERSKGDEGTFPAEVVSQLAIWLDSLDRI